MRFQPLISFFKTPWADKKCPCVPKYLECLGYISRAMGVVYLIQPAELVGTKRYKVGMSEKDDLSRITKGFKKGTKTLCVLEVDNPRLVEQNLKDFFTEKYKLIAGTEYFEGAESTMKTAFLKISSGKEMPKPKPKAKAKPKAKELQKFRMAYDPVSRYNMFGDFVECEDGYVGQILYGFTNGAATNIIVREI